MWEIAMGIVFLIVYIRLIITNQRLNDRVDALDRVIFYHCAICGSKEIKPEFRVQQKFFLAGSACDSPVCKNKLAEGRARLLSPIEKEDSK